MRRSAIASAGLPGYRVRCYNHVCPERALNPARHVRRASLGDRAMKASEIRLFGVSDDGIDAEHCQWCGATLDGDGRHKRPEPRYRIDGNRRLLVEIELWACVVCVGQSSSLTDTDR